ncbi:putative ATP-dependent DNA helicase HFM1, partial [Frankliniella fusca]
MDESEEIANSQTSGPISFDDDNEEGDSAEAFGKETVSSSASSANFTYGLPRRLFVDNGLRSIQEIPEAYRHVFKDYPCFNRVQSLVMDDVLYSAEPLVVTAPTGSGKTVIFELAIVQLLMSFDKPSICSDFKIVYMAPVKALCTEKLHDWARKFSKLNINCIEVTGDSDVADLNYLNRHHIVLTTPEKWDSLTRRWRDHCTLMKTVRLFLIDEVHILNDESRGPTLEAVVSRMKMLQQHQRADNQSLPSLRFIAVSATIPNVEDLAQWLGTLEKPAKYFRMEESMRPVQLKKVVKGYDSNFSGFMFDVHLSYKLKAVISQYSDGKPTLVFCSTRKSVLATAEVLAKMITFSFTETQKSALTLLCGQIVDNKIRDLAKVGIGCHHAGLVMTDRNLLESAFRDGLLPVLIATSTLAMGVNLPAHLVVIKSTQYYGNGGYQDYSDSQLLQMIGRAGRPQYDTSAVAVIMTKSTCE